MISTKLLKIQKVENLATFDVKKNIYMSMVKMSMTYELFKRAFRILILDSHMYYYKTILKYMYMIYTDDGDNGLEVVVKERKREFR